MPKKQSISSETLIEVILRKKEEIFNNSEHKIWGPTHNCWKDIARNLNNAVSSKYIYTVVLQNRFNILETLDFPRNACQNKNIINEVLNSSSDNDDCEQNTLEFNITLSVEEWKLVYDSENSYKRSDRNGGKRNYDVLTPYQWTNIFHEHFFEQTKQSCPIVYKYAKICQTGNIYLKIFGQCSTCRSFLKGIVHNPPEPESRVVIECSYTGIFKNCKSGYKRRIIGKKRDEFSNKLIQQNMSASYIQKIEAKKLMNYGDPEPSNLPTMNALRVLKYQNRQKDKLHKDPIMSLAQLKGSAPFNTILHDIGYDRFFLHYWTATEINTYRLYSKQNKLPRISIDATGGIIKKLNLISGRETSPIFLYEIRIMDYTNECQFTVAHMLSERHDSNSICHWLTEWSRNNIKAPRLVVTDQSLALMIAVVKAFTQFSTLSKYLSVCSSLILKETVELPICMLRNDINHVMHLISTWAEIKSCNYRIKNFYLRSIGLVVSSTEFEDIKNLLKNIFTVALSEECGLNSYGIPNPCHVSKNYLKERISTHILKNNEDLFKNNEEEDHINDNEIDAHFISEDITLNNIFQELQSIYEICLKNCQDKRSHGDDLNAHYNKDISKKLLNFCKLLPCWSAVMIPFFKYGNIIESSSTSESMFNDLKNRIFQHKTLPLRLDEFVQDHISSITGSVVQR